MNLDVHQFDYWVKEKRQEIIDKYLPRIRDMNEIDTEEIWNNIYQESKDYSNEIKMCIERIKLQNDFDNNIQLFTKRLGAYVFTKISVDMKPLFYLQFEDIHITNGYCAQGQTNRFLQVLIPFLDHVHECKQNQI